MTPHQVELVQRSFAALTPHADDVAETFYQRLFTLDPVLYLLFPLAMADQRCRLMTGLAVVVQALDRPAALISTLEALGRRHAAYGIRARDYATVGAALFATLAQWLGAGFDSEVETAWSAGYALVVETMQGRMQKAA